MMRWALATAALVGSVTGYAAAGDPSQWPTRFHEAGATSQQLTEDGAGCLGAPTSPWTGTTGRVGGVSGIGPLPGNNREVELDPFAECMKTKG